VSLIHFLPGVVKELVRHVPDLALEITDWNGVKRDLPTISRRLLTRAGVEELTQAQKKSLSNFVHFTSRAPGDDRPSQEMNNAILKYYFAQLFVKEGVFIDLRNHHFLWKNDQLNFHPSGFWYQFSEPFRSGIVTLYRGFYRGNESLFEEGLARTGLLNRAWSGSEQNKIKTLFRSHFGESLEHPMSFNLKDFQESFLRIFQFLVEKKVRLSSEFMVFGIYLVTLYLTLEEGGYHHSVKAIFLEVDRLVTSPKEDQKE
jgi:hypothetical protein